MALLLEDGERDLQALLAWGFLVERSTTVRTATLSFHFPYGFTVERGFAKSITLHFHGTTEPENSK